MFIQHFGAKASAGNGRELHGRSPWAELVLAGASLEGPYSTDSGHGKGRGGRMGTKAALCESGR